MWILTIIVVTVAQSDRHSSICMQEYTSKDRAEAAGELAVAAFASQLNGKAIYTVSEK